MFCLEEGHHKFTNGGNYHVKVIPQCGVQFNYLTMCVSIICNNLLCIK